MSQHVCVTERSESGCRPFVMLLVSFFGDPGHAVPFLNM